MASEKFVISNGMNLEIDETNIPNNVARFIKGWVMSLNENEVGSESSNSLVLTKDESNEQFGNIELPAGVNKSIRGGFVPETGMYYSCIWNSLNQHSIWQLNAYDRTITKVMQNSCLDFKYDARHFISNTRFTYVVYDSFDKNGVKSTKTWIYITDDNSRTKQIQVEDAIATNGFTHSFFGNNTCCTVCDMITMGAPGKPTGCIGISPVPRPDTAEEKAKPNAMNFKVWQWRLKAIDVWGRESIHGVISKQYYNSASTSCSVDETTFPRCVDLTLDAECPYIAKLVVEYRNCGVGNSDQLTSDWKEHETIEKYSDCTYGPGLTYIPEFWLRSINPKYLAALSEENSIHYDSSTNQFTVRFCGNKECKSISKAQTDITQNYIANKSNSVFRLGNKIGVADNERGFPSLGCGQQENIRFNTEVDSNCNPLGYAKITIWAYIYSPIDNEVTNIRYIEKTSGAAKTTVAFGRIGTNGGTFTPTCGAKDNPFYYNQVFNGVNGFVMYPVGHPDVYAISKQYDISSGTPVLVGPMQIKSNSKNIIQKWEFYLPKGKYLFEIGDPMAGITTSIAGGSGGYVGLNYRDTSSTMIGLTSISNVGSLVSEQYQIEVDTCSGDFELYQTPVMIWDLTSDVNSSCAGNFPNVIKGRLQNGSINNAPNGIEGANLQDISPSFSPNYHPVKTDSKGWYFMTTKGSALGVGTELQGLLSVLGCLPQAVNTLPSTVTDEYRISFDQVTTDYFTIKGVVTDCVTNKPIEGMVVIYENGRFAKTNSLGEFSIIAHGLVRTDKIIISNQVGSGCLRTVCGDPCDTCFPKLNVTVPACGGSRIYELDIEVQSSELNTTQTLLEGKYGMGIVLEDCLGMETFVQQGNYIDIANTNEINTIGFDFTGLSVPTNFKKLSIYVTENLTYEDWMEWAVDYVVLEDNNGYISDPAASVVQITDPKRLRIYISSLVEYTAYSQSNTSWQFLKGDLLKIFELGNGDPINISKLVSYREGQDYVTIEYDSATMSSIITNGTGAKVRLLRPRTCATTEGYYQLCRYINITNGVPDTLTGILDYSNVFKVSRSIPIYENVIAVQETTVNVYNTNGDVISTKQVTIPVSTPTSTGLKRQFIFNHHSPSDFWGNKCWGRGRVNVVNQFEKIHRFGTEISLGNGISPEGNTNYLHLFTTDNATTFDEQVFNRITGVVTGQNIILAICTNDYFTLLYDQNEFRVDSKTGQIFSNSAANRFGKPRTKVGDDFGCSQDDINTIYFKNGFVFYLDSKRCAIVRHNFDEAKDFTPEGAKGWLQEKIHSNAVFNKTQTPDFHKIFHGVVCPKKDEYIFTSVQLFSDNRGSQFYVNNLKETNVSANEAISVDINDPKRKFVGMHHCTPEMFDIMFSDEIGQQLISWAYGVPFIHYPLLDAATTFLNFYGIQCKPVIQIICNVENTKDKNFGWVEAKLKQHQLYADEVKTEAGQLSKIMPLNWKRVDNFWTAPFMCQINGVTDPNIPNNTGVNSVMDGQTLYGKWVSIRLITKDADDNKYAELGAIIVNFK